MKPELPDDAFDELGELLRNVEIPTDLKSRLLAISHPDDSIQLNSIQPVWPGRLAKFVTLAVAASMLGVISIASWPLLNPATKTARVEHSSGQSNDRPATDSSTPPIRSDPGEIQIAQTAAQTLLRDIENRQLEIDRIFDQIKLNQLRSELAAMNRVKRTPRISPVDEMSLILVLADQAGIAFGNDVRSVRKDLERTIERYPNSAGAELATTFISENEF